MIENNTKKIKQILFVHQGFELYGSDRMLLLNIKAVREKYNEQKIVVVLPKKGLLSNILQTEYKVEVVIKNIGVIRKYDLKRFNFSAFLKIFTFFRLIGFINSFEMVFINSIVIADYILALRFTKAKAFIHVHELPLNFSAKIFSKLLNFSKADLIFISSASKNAFINLKNKKQFILWNGVSPLKASIREEKTKNKIRLLLIGRINNWKGQLLLIKAICLLNEKEKELIEVKIVGDVFMNQDSLRNKLIEQIKDGNLENSIELLPFTSKPEMLYNWSDAVIVPSLLPEPFGLVAIEAMSLGKLVIAANHGGLSEIIENNISGMLFEPGNEKDLALKISKIIQNPLLIKGLGNKGFEVFISKFTEEIYINKFMEII